MIIISKEIEKCNFKYNGKETHTWSNMGVVELKHPRKYKACSIATGANCCGEDKCILHQTYKNTLKTRCILLKLHKNALMTRWNIHDDIPSNIL